MGKQSSNETYNYMKSKGKVYIFVIHPLLYSGVTTIIIVGFQYLFLRLDYGKSFAKELFMKGITSGWHIILFVFIGMCIVQAIINGMRWTYHKKKSTSNH